MAKWYCWSCTARKAPLPPALHVPCCQSHMFVTCCAALHGAAVNVQLRCQRVTPTVEQYSLSHGHGVKL